MTKNRDNFDPNDPLYLFSRGLDENLNDEERSRLDAAMQASVEFASEAEQLRAVARLMRRWAARKAEPGEPFTTDAWGDSTSKRMRDRETVANATGEESRSAEDLSEVDQVLERWARRTAEIPWEEFTESVMAEIRPAARKGRTAGRIVRWTMPLAAAAVLALAVLPLFRVEEMHAPRFTVAFGPDRVAELAGSRTRAEDRRVVVSFGTEREFTGAPAPQAMSYGFVGSDPSFAVAVESPPL